MNVHLCTASEKVANACEVRIASFMKFKQSERSRRSHFPISKFLKKTKRIASEHERAFMHGERESGKSSEASNPSFF